MARPETCAIRLTLMPEAEYTWLPKDDILHFEEIVRLVRIFVTLGVHRVRLTGGEPLLRRDLATLVRLLAAVPGIDDLALTTNGVLLADHVHDLRDAGLGRLTVSLDTLDRQTFISLTRSDELDRVRAGLEAGARAFPGLKIDAVVLRGVNDHELPALMDEAARLGAELRFIEYMTRNVIAPANFVAWRERSKTLEQLGMVGPDGLSAIVNGEPTSLKGLAASYTIFTALGVQPALGRAYTYDEDLGGKGGVIVLSYEYWQARMGGRRDVLGMVLSTNDGPRTIIGVMGSAPFDWICSGHRVLL